MGRALKGDAADAWTRSADPGARFILIASDDEGRVEDAARDVALSWRDASGPAEWQSLAEDVLKGQGGALLDALAMQPLLGARPAFRLAVSGDRHASALGTVLGRAASLSDLNPLILTSGKLKKGAKLRDLVEGHPAGVVLEFYPETQAETERRVEAELRAQGVSISAQALSRLCADLPGHRGLANQEVEKFALYAQGLGRALDVDDVAALSAIDTEAGVYSYVDAVFSGREGDALTTLDRLLLAGHAPIGLMRALQRETEKLLALQGALAEGLNEGQAGRRVRPPVPDWAWPGLRPRLKAWPVARLVRILARLHEAEAMSKRAGPLAEALLSELTGGLAAAAAPSGGRR